MHYKLHLKLLVAGLKYMIMLVALIVLISVYGFMLHINRGINLMQNDSWLNFPGAEITPYGVSFKPLGQIIVHQDGSVGQPNPPVNLSGQHIKVKGDFEIKATLLQVDKWASFRLYASPPIIYDQWRYEPPSIDININVSDNIITARIWDGNSSNSMDIRTYNVPLTSKIIISLEHVKDKINIIKDDRLLGSIPDHNIFDGGSVWFGVDSAIGSDGWTLAALNANNIGDGIVELASPQLLIVNQYDSNSFRNLADSNSAKIKIGTTVDISRLITDEQYKTTVLSQFNIITPENSMKPEFIHPASNVYVFEEADLLVDTALKNKITVHGHTLVYVKSTSDWMINSIKEQRQTIMISHIKNVVDHFKGRVAEWDVVNEPLSDKNSLYKYGGTGISPNIWFEAMGEKYIDIAFKTAREVDPSAKLYLNEYGIENDGQRWDALLSLVKRLKQRGVPIDGIGFEAHIYNDGDYIHVDQLKKHMEILGELGLLARISEIDVTGDDQQEQINQYVAALDTCLGEPNCTSYTTWGVTDKYGSTTRSDRYPLVYGSSLLWDKNMEVKPAYTALQNRLRR